MARRSYPSLRQTDSAHAQRAAIRELEVRLAAAEREVGQLRANERILGHQLRTAEAAAALWRELWEKKKARPIAA